MSNVNRDYDIYRLEARYDIVKYRRVYQGGPESDPEYYDSQTSERLSISDNMDLTSGMGLIDVLAILGNIHTTLQDSMKGHTDESVEN